MTRYVLGFAFDGAGKNVVLIRKNKPIWQAGKFNGVGGKIEKGETALRAMTREFNEETGVITDQHEWNLLGFMNGTDWECVVFHLFRDEVVELVKTTTDEEVHTFPVFIAQSEIPTISNVPWLIEAARNQRQKQDFKIEVKYA